MAANTKPVTAEQLLPQMKAMSKDSATQMMVSQWGAVSDRTVVGRAMYDDLTLDLRPGPAGRGRLASSRLPITMGSNSLGRLIVTSSAVLAAGTRRNATLTARDGTCMQEYASAWIRILGRGAAGPCPGLAACTIARAICARR